MKFLARPLSQEWLENRRGVTLLELMASLSLAVVVGLLAWSMFRQESSMIRHLLGRSQRHSQATAFSETLAQGLILGKGLRELSPNSLKWIDRQGHLRQLRMAWGDTVLSSESHHPLDSVCGFQVSAFGRQAPTSPSGFSAEPDSLDRDDNGFVDWDELDQNHDAVLDTSEIPELRVVVITWHACGDTTQHRLVASPRNRRGPPPTSHRIGNDFDF